MANEQASIAPRDPTMAQPSARRSYWAPKIWHGMTLPAWLRLLARHRFAVAPRFWPIAAGITVTAAAHSCLALVQRLNYQRAIDRVRISQPPIFILGHWRSGTTLLQRYFALDDRLTYPTAYECFAPQSNLVSGFVARRLFGRAQPTERSMDNMATSPDHPHEDEFALCNMGLGSPYERLAFPNSRQINPYLDFQGVSPKRIARWQAGLLAFVRQLTWRSGGKRVVLKSPPHTARIKLLLELFPDARFVHLVRNPLTVIPSTIWLWKSLYTVHGLQLAQGGELEKSVFDEFLRMHRVFQEQELLIPAGHLCEIRYEQLIRDPLSQLALIYERLELSGFDELRAELDQVVESKRDHQANRYEITPQLEAEIHRRCFAFIHQYGYDSGDIEKRSLA